MPKPEISPEIIRLIDEMEVFVRAAAQLSQHPAPEDIVKKNLRLLNVVMTGADKDFIEMLPEVNRPEARKLFTQAREVFGLYIGVYNQFLTDRMQGIPETEALEFARQTMEEEQKPLELV